MRYRYIAILSIIYFSLSTICQCQVNQAWLARYIGPGNQDFIRAMVIDCYGNVYVTGDSRRTSNAIDFATVKYSTDGVQRWVARYNWPNLTGGAFASPSSIAVDKNGNVYVAGVAPINSTGNPGKTTTVKYNSSGVQQWVAIFYGPFYDAWPNGGTSVSVDDSCNVYVAGSIDWGTPTGYDYTTLKYDSNGTQQWVKTYSGSGTGLNSDDRPCKLVLDNLGNVIETGFVGSDSSYHDIATVKYNSAGTQQWAVRYNGPANRYDSASALAVDNSGNVYVTGRTWGGAFTGFDYVTIKYNSSGVQQWVQTYNGFNGEDGASSIAVDNSGNVYVTGYSWTGNVHYWDCVTVKYDSSGNQKWVTHYDNGSQDFGVALALDYQGYIYVTSRTSPVLRTHFTTIKYSPTGVQQWAVVSNANQDGESPTAIAVDSLDNVYVAGSDGHFLTIKYNQVSGITPISNEVPAVYRLYQNYPNPFNPSTKIKFDVRPPLSPLLGKEGTGVFLKIYDLLGCEITTLVNQQLNPAAYEVEFDGANYPSGVYFYRLTTNDYTVTKKMVLVK